MTLRMADSTVPANLPAGYDAYAGYVDGYWPDDPAIKARFPGAHILGIAARAADDAEALDVEPFDAANNQASAWLRRQQARGISRPVIYSSVSNVRAVLDDLAADAITRPEVRVWSAHYGDGQHICGPASCAWPGVPPCDGTQWTDTAPGLNGSKVDESLLLDNFFGTPAPSTWQEDMMRQLPTLSADAKGQDVRSIQGLCGARSHTVTVDGVFGPVTESAVKAVQAVAKLAQDGIVGQQTWQALMDV